ncbi:class I SAM-dependent methyltransferase [bacterium]|nr:class I SAM-dependent methyltransferase [candidate division CSSED10-310 bacterium]
MRNIPEIPDQESLFEDAFDLFRFGFEDAGRRQLDHALQIIGQQGRLNERLATSDRPDPAQFPERSPWHLHLEEIFEESAQWFRQVAHVEDGDWEPFLRLGEALAELPGENDFEAVLETALRLGAPANVVFKARMRGLFRRGRYEDVIAGIDIDPGGMIDGEMIDLRRHAEFQRDVMNFGGRGFLSLLKSPIWCLKLLLLPYREYLFQMYTDRLMAIFPGSSVMLRLHSLIMDRMIDIRRMSLGSVVTAAERSIHCRPDRGIGYVYLARSQCVRHRFRRAETVCRSGLASAGASPELMLVLGHALAGQRRWQEAAEWYRAAVVRGREPVAQINEAAAWMAAGDPQSARDLLTAGDFSILSHPLADALMMILEDTATCAVRYHDRYSQDPGRWLHRRSATWIDRTQDSIVYREGRVPGITRMDRSRFRTIDCPICHAAPTHQHRIFIHPVTHLHVCRCTECGYVFTCPQPAPDQIGQLYPLSYFNFDMERAEWYRRIISRHSIPLHYYEARFRWLESIGLAAFEDRCGPARRTLDVGCSSGLMLFEMERRGWTCAGLDIVPEMTAYLAGKGYDVYTGTTETVSVPEGRFQFVSLLHVIEHVLSPEALLRFARHSLSVGGWLFVVTPCCMTPPAVYAGRDWFDDMTHLHFFDRKSLSILIERTGFEIMAVYCPCGVRFETHNRRWTREMMGPAVENVLTDAGMGDVIWIVAKAQ